MVRNETDAWWFDNVRLNAERLESSYKRATALTLGMMVGDYVLSFDKETWQMRRALISLESFPANGGVASPFPVRQFGAQSQHE